MAFEAVPTRAGLKTDAYGFMRWVLDPFRIGIQELRTDDIGQDLLNRPAALIERRLRQADGRRVGVGDRDASVPLAAHHPRKLLVRPGGVVERVLACGVSVRPSVDGDGLDVAGGVEPAV